jgi:opacity protein-like surface antigen
VFSYKYEAQLGGLSLMEGTRNLSFTMLDLSAWYFQPVYRDWLKLFVRAGLGSTVVSDEWEGEELDSESSAGVLVAGGVETFFGKSFGMNLEVYYRSYGVTLEGMNSEEVHAAGLVLNLVWR